MWAAKKMYLIKTIAATSFGILVTAVRFYWAKNVVPERGGAV